MPSGVIASAATAELQLPGAVSELTLQIVEGFGIKPHGIKGIA
jgi:hypothetical protein